jgi:hypothetical protein
VAFLFNLIFELQFLCRRKGSKNGAGVPKRRHGKEKERYQFGSNRFGWVVLFISGQGRIVLYCILLYLIVGLFVGGICKS